MTSSLGGRGIFVLYPTGCVDYLHDLNIFIITNLVLGLHFCDYIYQHGRLLSLI